MISDGHPRTLIAFEIGTGADGTLRIDGDNRTERTINVESEVSTAGPDEVRVKVVIEMIVMGYAMFDFTGGQVFIDEPLKPSEEPSK
jgi:hypothetical protein